MNNPNNNQDDQNYLKTLTVLYVEDEDDIRGQLCTYLGRRVRHCYTANNGKTGLEAFLQYHPNIVITDIRMPVMDGLEMLGRIRAMNPDIPIIVTTAFEESRYFQRAIDLSVNKYVTKPIQLEILEDALFKSARHLRSEAALHEIEDRYRLLFKLSHIAISISEVDMVENEKLGIFNIDGVITDCNPTFLELLGYQNQAELFTLPFSQLIAPQSVGTLNKLIREELLVRDFTRECELDLRHKNGTIVPVVTQLILRRNAAGQATEAWAVMRDISEQQQSAQALRLAASVYENTGEAILITDKDNCILSVNQAFSKITGYSAAEVIGQNPRLLQSNKHDSLFYHKMWGELNATGHWQGEIWNRRKSGEFYPEWMSITVVHDEQGHTLNYIGIFSDLSESNASKQHIEFLAHYDPLTRLANRTLLEDRARQTLSLAVRNKTRFALMFIDLDRFKMINDSLGHAAGDQVLNVVANRLQKMLREVDVVARLGGDEFVIILNDLRDKNDALLIAEKLITALDMPMVISGREVTVTSSIGVSLYPQDGTDYETLLKNADTAMYNAKKAGRNNFMFYTRTMSADMLGQLTIENALRSALADNEFELHYQPQWNIKTGRIIGMEALLRWKSAKLGSQLPSDFIPLTEETGLIVSIGEWVLREACRQNSEWQQQGLPTVVIAVNLSAVQFRQENLLSVVKNALKDSSLAANYLELELTEGAVMQNVEIAIECVNALKELGIQISIDDFGTGYSSLSYLKRFAISKLKIDQSFVCDIANDDDNKAIVIAIISLAHALNLSVIAEGVENVVQLDFLRSHQCDEVQGYFYSKPVPAAEMKVLLEKDKDLHE